MGKRNRNSKKLQRGAFEEDVEDDDDKPSTSQSTSFPSTSSQPATSTTSSHSHLPHRPGFIPRSSASSSNSLVLTQPTSTALSSRTPQFSYPAPKIVNVRVLVLCLSPPADGILLEGAYESKKFFFLHPCSRIGVRGLETSYAFYQRTIQLYDGETFKCFVSTASETNGVRENGPDFPWSRHKSRHIKSSDHFHFIVIPDKWDRTRHNVDLFGYKMHYGSATSNTEVHPTSMNIFEDVFFHCAPWRSVPQMYDLLGYVLGRRMQWNWPIVSRCPRFDATHLLAAMKDKTVENNEVRYLLLLVRRLRSLTRFCVPIVVCLPASAMFEHATRLRDEDMSDFLPLCVEPSSPGSPVDPLLVCLIRCITATELSLRRKAANDFRSAAPAPLCLSPGHLQVLSLAHTIGHTNHLAAICTLIVDAEHVVSSCVEFASTGLFDTIVTSLVARDRRPEYRGKLVRLNHRVYVREWSLFLMHTSKSPLALASGIPFSMIELLGRHGPTIEDLSLKQRSAEVFKPLLDCVFREPSSTTMPPSMTLTEHIARNFVTFFKHTRFSSKKSPFPQNYFDFLVETLPLGCSEQLVRQFYTSSSAHQTEVQPKRLKWLFEHLRQKTAHPLIEMEQTTIKKLVDDAALSDLEKYKDFLMQKTCEEYVALPYHHTLYMMTWHKLFVSRAANRPLDFESHVVDAVPSKTPWLYKCLVEVGCNNLMKEVVHLSSVGLHQGDSGERQHQPDAFIQHVVVDAFALAQSLETGQVFVSVFDFFFTVEGASGLLRSLLDAIPTTAIPTTATTAPRVDVSEAVDSLHLKKQKVENMWAIVTTALESMTQREPIKVLAAKRFHEHTTLSNQLPTLWLCKWQTPSVPDLLKTLSERLAVAGESTLFLQIWHDKAASDTITAKCIAPTSENLLDFWVTYVQGHFEKWLVLMTATLVGDTPLCTAETFLSKFVRPPSTYRSDMSEQVIRYEIDHATKNMEALIKVEAVAVGKLALQLKHPLEITQVEFTARIMRVLHVAWWKEEAEYLLDLVNALELTGDGVDEVRAFREAPSTAAFKTLSTLFDAMMSNLNDLETIIPGYIRLFSNVVIKQGLLDTFLTYRTLDAIDRRIDARQGEELSLEIIHLLTALRSAVRKYMALKEFNLAQLRQSSVCDVVTLLARTSFAVVDLRVLFGQIDTCNQILNQVSDEMQGLTVVKTLLAGDGIFHILVNVGTVTVFAQQKDGTVIPPEEFRSLRSRLVLTSGISPHDADTMDVDVPLPLNFAKPEERELYVSRFSKLFDLTFELAQIVKDLANAGHPDFQHNKLSLPCAMHTKSLQECVRRNTAELHQWTESFNRYLERYPSLSFFSRSQLVECLSAMSTKPVDVKVVFSNLLSLGGVVNLDTVTATCSSITNQQSATDLFSVLDVLINKCVRPHIFAPLPECAEAQTAADVVIPDRLLYGLFRIAHATDEEVVVGYHIARLHRLPLPLEMLFCSPTTTCVDISDFLHRWYHMRAGVATAENDGKGDGAMFWLVQVDKLEFTVQQYCIQTLRAYERRAGGTRFLPDDGRRPLLLLTTDTTTSHISSALTHCEVSVSKASASELINNIGLVIKTRELYVVRSAACAVGKTSAVVSQLVVGKTNNLNRPMQHAQFSVDLTPMSHPLSTLATHRPLTSPEGVVLHFNVGHMADPRSVNRFILQYAILGCWLDGCAFPRHPDDIIVFELCNTGYADERDRIGITKHFRELTFPMDLSAKVFKPVPSPRSARYTVMTENLDDNNPCVFTLSFNANPGELMVLPAMLPKVNATASVQSHAGSGGIVLEGDRVHVRLAPGETKVVCTLQQTTSCTLGFDVVHQPNAPLERVDDGDVGVVAAVGANKPPLVSLMHTGILYEYDSVDDVRWVNLPRKEGQPSVPLKNENENENEKEKVAEAVQLQLHRQTLSVMYQVDVCMQAGERRMPSALDVMTAEPDMAEGAITQLMYRLSQADSVSVACRDTYVRRFYKVSLALFKNVNEFPAWHLPSICELPAHETCHYFQLTYYILQLLLRICRDLSKPMIEPADIKTPTDDVQRCVGMHKFDDMHGKTYVVCSPNDHGVLSFSILSFGGETIFDEVSALAQADLGNKTGEFFVWLTQYSHSDQTSKNREHLQNLCDSLATDPRDDYGKTVLEFLTAVGCVGPVSSQLEAVQQLKKTSGTESLDLFADNATVQHGLAHLVRMSREPPPTTVSEFLSSVMARVASIFGFDNPDKPPYRLTVDLLLRLVAVRMRMLSSTSICLMGETGCGKTEMVCFLSKLNGQGFAVINVEEGMTEIDLATKLEPTMFEATMNPDRQFTVVLDEANTTSFLWTVKDVFCDGILDGVRFPPNVGFVVIMNPWKRRTEAQQKAKADMDVGGLDFLKYQQATNSSNSNNSNNNNNNNNNAADNTTNTNKGDRTSDNAGQLDLVYQVHSSPETWYSHVWDFGSASSIHSKATELGSFERNVLWDKFDDDVTDEAQMALHMVQWLEQHICDRGDLLRAFHDAGDTDDGKALFRKPFRTIVVELLLHSQQFLREQVYQNETSVVSIRDMRKACDVFRTVFLTFWPIRERLQPEGAHHTHHNPTFMQLTESLHCALITTYCLRLDDERRTKYAQSIRLRWKSVRDRFPNLAASFLPAPAGSTIQQSELYKSFTDLASFTLIGITIESGIAPNEALKENVLTMLLAIYLKTTLFVVGRPGSTKSRSLELLCDSTMTRLGILSELRLKIQKHVVQCSPYTTSAHVNQQARSAASFQYSARLHDPQDEHRFVLVLEEVGATIGSVHNPLMSLHGLIDHGVQIRSNGANVMERIAIIGLSNYSLDASKMGRGNVCYRGHPSIQDLKFTAEKVLRDIDEEGSVAHLHAFATAMYQNILMDDNLTWYHGMRDFYGSIKTMQRLATPLQRELSMQGLVGAKSSQMTSHVARWTVLVNLRGFPDRATEMKLANEMFGALKLDLTGATWTWVAEKGSDPKYLCDACCRMQLYRRLLVHRVDHPDIEITTDIARKIFFSHASDIKFGSFPCQFFNGTAESEDFAPEVIAFSLWNTSARHPMIFTQANAALSLLESMKLVNLKHSTVIFNSTVKEEGTTKSELVQQMIRVRSCMREGQTLILVRSRHIYESLLDALNGHYIKETSLEDDGEVLHRTMLSLAGETKSVYVKPSFRCIVLESIRELKDHVLPPFINRCNKTTLTFRSCLTPHQKDLRHDFVARMDAKLEGGDDTVNILSLLAPGCNYDTLDSTIHLYGSGVKAFENVLCSLCLCLSRKNCRRLVLRLVKGLNSDSVVDNVKWWQREFGKFGLGGSFDTVAPDALRYFMCDDEIDDESDGVAETNDNDDNDNDNDNDNGKREDDNAVEDIVPHLAVITEQMHVDFGQLSKAVTDVYKSVDETETCFLTGEAMVLNHVSLTNVETALFNLQRTHLLETESAVCLFVLDRRTTDKSIVDLDAFMFTVSSHRNLGARRHVLLVVNISDVLLRDPSEKALPFKFAMSTGWCILNVDEIVETEIAGPNLPWISEGHQLNDTGTEESDKADEGDGPTVPWHPSLLSLAHLDTDQCLHELLVDSVIVKLILQPDVLTWLAQELSANPTHVQESIDSITTVFQSRTELTKAILTIACERLHKAHVESAIWMQLAFRKAKHTSASLRSVYLTYLSGVAVRLVHPILLCLVRFGTLSAVLANVEFLHIVSQCLPRLVADFDVDGCIHLNLPDSGGGDVSVGNLKFSSDSVVTFPFSPLLAVHLNTHNVEDEWLQLVKHWSLDNHPELVLLYVKDMLEHGLQVPADRIELMVALIRRDDAAALLSPIAIHKFLFDSAWVVAARRFCNLEHPAGNLDVFFAEDEGNRGSQHVLSLATNSEGIVPMHAIALIRIVLRDDRSVKWWALRASSLALQHCTTDKERTVVKQALPKLIQDPSTKGIVYILNQRLTSCKVYLFEYFEHGDAGALEAAHILEQCEAECLSDETMLCSIAFLVRTLITALFQGRVNREASEPALVRIAQAKPPADLLLSHCITDVLLDVDHVDVFTAAVNYLEEMDKQSLLHEVVQSNVLVVALYHTIYNREDLLAHVDPAKVTNDIVQWCVANGKQELVRYACLFVVRQLSEGGCSGLDAALVRARSADFPDEIAKHAVLDAIIRANQKTSPLGSLPGFRDAINDLSSLAEGVAASQVALQVHTPSTRFAVVASHLLQVAPKPLDDLDAVLAQHTELLVTPELQPLQGIVPQLLQLTEQSRQLVLHAICLEKLGHAPHLTFAMNMCRESVVNKVAVDRTRLQVEELMVPRCPRCKGAFIDWVGCFAVKCPCGCGFCGVCLLDCGADAHGHVAQAHGNHFFSFNRFQLEFGAKATTQIRALLATLPPLQYTLLANLMPAILEKNMYSIRPDHVLARNNIGDDRPVPRDPNALLMYDALMALGKVCLRFSQPTLAGMEDVSWEAIGEELEHVMERMQVHLFPGGEDEDDVDGGAKSTAAFTWAHAMLHSVCKLEGVVDMTRQQCIDDIQRVSQLPPHQLMSDFTAECATSEEILLELRFDASYDKQQTPVARLFRNRSTKTERQLRAHVMANPDLFPLLRLIMARASSLTQETTAVGFRVVRFLNMVQQAATRQRLSKVQADNVTFSDFVNSAKIAPNLADGFKEDVRKVMTKLRRWQCNDTIADTFKDLRHGPQPTTSLSHFLPADSGPGIFAKALWSGKGDGDADWMGIGVVQNEIVLEISEGRAVGELLLSEATENDVIRVDINALVSPLFNLFVVPGYHPTFTDDLVVVEDLLKFGTSRLSNYLQVPGELPSHEFSTDVITMLLTKLQTKLLAQGKDFETMTRTVISSMDMLLKRAHHIPDSIFAYSLAVGKQLSTMDEPLPELLCSVVFSMPLTQDQEQGKQILMQVPAMRTLLKTTQLAALLSYSWRGEGIHMSVDVDVSEEDEVQIEEGLTALKNNPRLYNYIPGVMSSLRLIGLTQFTSEVEAGTSNSPLNELLEYCVLPPADDDDEESQEFLDKPPFTMPARHFGTVMRTALHILGPEESKSGRGEDSRELAADDDFVLPFSVDQQFLRATSNANHDLNADAAKKRGERQQKNAQDRLRKPTASGHTDTNASDGDKDSSAKPANSVNMYHLQPDANVAWERGLGSLKYD